jgi:hypothetical protein
MEYLMARFFLLVLVLPRFCPEWDRNNHNETTDISGWKRGRNGRRFYQFIHFFYHSTFPIGQMMNFLLSQINIIRHPLKAINHKINYLKISSVINLTLYTPKQTKVSS